MSLQKIVEKISAISLLIGMVGCCFPDPEKLPGERIAFAREDYEWLAAYPPDLSHPLTLNEIIEIALCKNLELWAKEQEYLIQADQALKFRYALLPDLNFNFEDNTRSRTTASSSEFFNPITNTPTAPIFSVSAPKHIQSWDFGLVFNALDFGVNYFRARQQENRAITQCYQYERIKNSLILRIVSSYWRAVSSKQALDRANELLPEMFAQNEKLQREISEGIYLTKSQALSKVIFFYQREIQVRGYNDRNDSSDPTQGYEKEYQAALLELSSLMQLPPGASFDVYVPTELLPYDVKLPTLEQLFILAFDNRPELYENDLQYKISLDEAKIGLTQMMPGIQLFNIENYNSNPFLLYNRWYTAGFRVAWSLLDYPQHVMDYLTGINMIERDRRNRLLVSEGVLTQVALAYMQYQQNVDQYLLSLQVANATQDTARLAFLESEVGRKSKLEALQAKIDASLAFNNTGKIYSELQSNLEQLNNAIGVPRYFSTFRPSEFSVIESPEENGECEQECECEDE